MSHEDDPILRSALDVFSERGLRRGTLGEVARRAGVGRATLYRRYPNKDAVVQALVLSQVRELFAVLDEAFAGEDTGLDELLRRGVRTCFAWLRSHSLLQRVLADEPETILPALTVQAAPLVSAAVDFLSPYVARATKESSTQPEVIAEWGVRIVLSLVLLPPVSDDDIERFVSVLLPEGGTP